MKNSKFTSFTLPHSLTTLNLSRTPICFLPRSIKDIGTLNYLSLAEWKMLQTLLEIPSSLVGLDVSYCYSLQRIANLIPFTIARDCDQLVHIQDWIKLELIQKVDSHLLRIMEMVSVQIQTWRFQVLPRPFYCISTLHFCTSWIFRKFSLCSFYNFCFDGTDRTSGQQIQCCPWIWWKWDVGVLWGGRANLERVWRAVVIQNILTCCTPDMWL